MVWQFTAYGHLYTRYLISLLSQLACYAGSPRPTPAAQRTEAAGLVNGKAGRQGRPPGPAPLPGLPTTPPPATEHLGPRLRLDTKFRS